MTWAYVQGKNMHKATITAALAAASLLTLSACNKQPGSRNEGTPAAAAGADAINGTWKASASDVRVEQQPDHVVLQNGQYSCDTCVPKIAMAADGAYHPVHAAYYDSLAVKVVDDRTISYTRKKGNEVVGEFIRSVSADGKTLTTKFKDSSTPNAPPVVGQYTSTRVGEAPVGAHATSGSWQPEKIESVSDEALTTTYALEGDVLHMSTPTGQSYDAKLDGTDTPIKGDSAGTTASVKRTANGFEETDKRDGKVVGVATFGVGADGKLHITFVDKDRNQTTRLVATKQ
jgi:hypothetical protein